MDTLEMDTMQSIGFTEKMLMVRGMRMERRL